MADPIPVPQNPVTPPVIEPEATAPAPTPDTEHFDSAETRRRFERLERQLYQLAGQMVQQTPAPAQAPQGPQDLKDEELWSLAQQGNRQAFELYMERIARRTSGVQINQAQQEQVVANQLSALYQKYPELGDPQNPLTQRAVQFKAALLQMGSPNSRQTDLDAILRAVADSRDLIAPKQALRAVPTAGQIGVSHQASPAPTPTTPAVTPEEASLAKKYGALRSGPIDPAKAKERFWKRQDEGRSTVSPTIASAVREG